LKNDMLWDRPPLRSTGVPSLLGVFPLRRQPADDKGPQQGTESHRRSVFQQSPQEGYISKCGLCLDLRRHFVSVADFEELKPKEFYRHLE